jgi:hypothetical protein
MLAAGAAMLDDMPYMLRFPGGPSQIMCEIAQSPAKAGFSIDRAHEYFVRQQFIDVLDRIFPFNCNENSIFHPLADSLDGGYGPPYYPALSRAWW